MQLRPSIAATSARPSRGAGALPGGVVARLVDRDDPFERLVRSAAIRMDGDVFSDARVLLVGFPQKHLAGLRRDLRDLGVRATAAAPSVRQLPDVAGMGLAFSHVIVHFDAFEDVEAGVNALYDFRRSSPGMVVIACSEFVSGDDLGGERAAICDATLRLPVSTPRLRDGFAAASVNHHDRAVSGEA